MKLIIRVLAVCFCLGVLVACGQSDGDSRSGGRRSESHEEPKGDSVTVTLIGEDSVSVFDLLRREHQVAFRSSAMGALVTAIDSFESGDGYYWVYSVNDTMAASAADKYITNDGDSVVWHFRRIGE